MPIAACSFASRNCNAAIIWWRDRTKNHKYKPQDWNTLVVTVHGNEAHCECNGEVLEDALKMPDTGPIGLEADRGQMEYRHIQITKPK